MLLKFVLIIVVFYLILRAAMNMWAAVQADSAARSARPEPDVVRKRVDGRSYDTILTSGPGTRTSESRRTPVDDARFTDL